MATTTADPQESKDKKSPLYYNAGPFNLAVIFPAEKLRQALDYKHEKGDTFIMTFPKNGTTWMQQVVHGILNDGSSGGCLAIGKPFIELNGDIAIQTRIPFRTAFKTHIRPDLLQANMHPEAKYIIVVRNPKDTVVSLYHHTKGFPFYEFTDGSFDVLFEIFMEGKTDFGDYMQWLTSAVMFRHQPNVLLLTYESMKKDFESSVLRVTQFLSTKEHDHVSRWNNDPEYRKRILTHSSLSFMKQELNQSMRDDTMNNFSYPEEKVSGLEFVRKGQVNEWREVLSQDQSRRLSQKFRSAAELCPDLMYIWDDYSWL